MRVRFYIDLFPGIDPTKHNLCASTSPMIKQPGVKRIAFDVAIPDALLFAIDDVSPEVGKAEEV